jgi:DNA polymerase-3 subunit delta'
MVLQSEARREVLEESERKGFAAILARGAEKPSARGALLVKASFEALLGARKAAIEAANEAAFKEESAAYKQVTDGNWLAEREKAYDAMAAAEYLAVRSGLVDWLIAWLGDAVRRKAGVPTLEFPEYAAETGRVAAGEDMDSLLRRVDALQGLRDILNTNVSEGLAIEVSFLQAFGA